MPYRFLRHLLALGMLAVTLTVLAISGLYVAATILAQRDPEVTIRSLAVDQVNVSTEKQLSVVTDLSVRKGCVPRLARGYVRPTPGVPGGIDIQGMTNLPLPVGITLDDLGKHAPQVSATPGPVEAKHTLIRYREFIPSPNNLEPGGGWRFAEFVSQEGCGWLHGLLPINTSLVLGPPINLN